MYRTSMYTGIKTSTFSTDLNTGHLGQFRAILGVPAGTEKSFFFLFFIIIIFLSFAIFDFLLGHNDNLFALTY